MRRILTLCILTFSMFQLAHAFPKPIKSINYVKVKAKAGQGAYGLLRSYKLSDKPDNVALFYKINGLKQNSSLEKNKSYLLPISVRSFDGKSIRSSVGIQNIEQAKKIENYNKQLTTQKLKNQDYKKDKKIWVPLDLDQEQLKAAKFNEGLAFKTSIRESIPSVSKKNRESRKEFLVASMAPIKSMLVADRKLTDKEVKELAEVSNAVDDAPTSLKVSSKMLSVPLFGDKYKDVEITDLELKDQVFYIVPGHGGPDPGAIAKNVDGAYTICEDEYAYDVSLRLAKNLMQKGATVFVIVEDENDGIRDDKYLECDKDETSYGGHDIPASQKKRLRQGMNKVNKLYSKYKKKGFTNQWMVSLHIDAQGEEDRQDVFFYYQSDSEKSKNKAVDIQQVFEEKYDVYRKEEKYNGTVSSRPLYVVRNSDPEPIFIELANIHNPEDRKRILFPKNRQLLADWITEGFTK